MQNPKLFGTDGVRGLANYWPMTPEIALALGRAAGKVFRSNSPEKQKIVIGKDTRLSCYMYENALIAGLCSMGIDTLMVGPLPTPGVAFITRAYRANAGIVISASHNPFYDNGIKFFSADGFKLPESVEEEIERLVFTNNFQDYLPPHDGIGKNTKIIDADGRYIEFVKGTLPKKLSLKGLKIVLDCANGAAWRVAPLVFQELDAKVFVYGNAPDGLNINDGCGALHPEKVQRAILEHEAHVGIALDGDADRVIMVDEKGNIVDGDALLAICAYDMFQKKQLRNNVVVSTVMANFGFMKAMESLGIRVIQSSVGDRFVIQEMLKEEAILGGEQSGHMVFLDYNTTGDGLVAALQVLRIMIETGTRLSELASIVTPYPQALVNVPVHTKPPLDSLKGVKAAVDRVTVGLEGRGRVLVRYSGTENICRVMIEGQSEKQTKEMANVIAQAIFEEIGKK